MVTCGSWWAARMWGGGAQGGASRQAPIVSTAAAISKLERATIEASASAAATISIAINVPLPNASTPPENIRAPATRQICANRLHCSLPRKVNASPTANTARPRMSAVSGLGTSAKAPPLTATTPNPTSMLIASELVSLAAKRCSRSASPDESFPSCTSLERSSVIFTLPPIRLVYGASSARDHYRDRWFSHDGCILETASRLLAPTPYTGYPQSPLQPFPHDRGVAQSAIRK